MSGLYFLKIKLDLPTLHKKNANDLKMGMNLTKVQLCKLKVIVNKMRISCLGHILQWKMIGIKKLTQRLLTVTVKMVQPLPILELSFF